MAGAARTSCVAGREQREANGDEDPVVQGHACLVPAVAIGVATGYVFRRGSRASRRPSPNRLIASTVIMITRPGTVVIHGYWRRKLRPSASILPHSAVGGCAPRP